MNPFDYVICWLITLAFSFSFAVTSGPFGLFEKVRYAVVTRFEKESWQYDGITCPICLSFYIAIPVTLYLGGGVLMWLSAAGFVTLVMALAPD